MCYLLQFRVRFGDRRKDGVEADMRMIIKEIYSWDNIR